MISDAEKGKTYLTKVVIEDGNTVILFPEDLLKAMNLQSNEILEWDVREDEFRIYRRKIIDPKNI